MNFDFVDVSGYSPIKSPKKQVRKLAEFQDKENMRPMSLTPTAAKESQRSEVGDREACSNEQAAEQLKIAQEQRLKTAREEAARAAEHVRAEVARMEAAAAAEAESIRQEALRVAEEKAAQKRAEEAAAKEQKLLEEKRTLARTKVNAWLKDNGYEAADGSKKTKFQGKTKFALHTAVKQRNPQMVLMLVLCGAQTDAQDSEGNTPSALAEKMEKSAVRDQLLDILKSF